MVADEFYSVRRRILSFQVFQAYEMKHSARWTFDEHFSSATMLSSKIYNYDYFHIYASYSWGAMKIEACENIFACIYLLENQCIVAFLLIFSDNIEKPGSISPSGAFCLSWKDICSKILLSYAYLLLHHSTDELRLNSCERFWSRSIIFHGLLKAFILNNKCYILIILVSKEWWISASPRTRMKNSKERSNRIAVNDRHRMVSKSKDL